LSGLEAETLHAAKFLLMWLGFLINQMQ